MFSLITNLTTPAMAGNPAEPCRAEVFATEYKVQVEENVSVVEKRIELEIEGEFALGITVKPHGVAVERARPYATAVVAPQDLVREVLGIVESALTRHYPDGVRCQTLLIVMPNGNERRINVANPEMLGR